LKRRGTEISTFIVPSRIGVNVGKEERIGKRKKKKGRNRQLPVSYGPELISTSKPKNGAGDAREGNKL